MLPKNPADECSIFSKDVEVEQITSIQLVNNNITRGKLFGIVVINRVLFIWVHADLSDII